MAFPASPLGEGERTKVRGSKRVCVLRGLTLTLLLSLTWTWERRPVSV